MFIKQASTPGSASIDYRIVWKIDVTLMNHLHSICKEVPKHSTRIALFFTSFLRTTRQSLQSLRPTFVSIRQGNSQTYRRYRVLLQRSKTRPHIAKADFQTLNWRRLASPSLSSDELQQFAACFFNIEVELKLTKFIASKQKILSQRTF